MASGDLFGTSMAFRPHLELSRSSAPWLALAASGRDADDARKRDPIEALKTAKVRDAYPKLAPCLVRLLHGWGCSNAFNAALRT
jgi:hypothetical protein